VNDDLGEWLIFGAAVLTAFLISHICSLLEAALLSITPSQVAALRRKSGRIGTLVFELKRRIEKPIAFILIVNTAAHTIGATVAGASLNELFHGKYMEVFSLLFTLFMVQYTEILPKTIGVRFNGQILRVAAIPLDLLTKLFGPLIWLTHWINRPFEKKNPEHPSTAEEISALAALARSSQMISSRQERIIRTAPHLSEKRARDVMIGVENISFLRSEHTMNGALKAAGMDFHTRYPVIEGGDKNHILGYINFKELVARHQEHPGERSILDIIRPPDFADPDDSAAELLERFATQHCHMMIVRDPVGGKTLGLVTLEDIVEELLGDLDDEFDPLPRTFYHPEENFWVVGGGVPLTLLKRDTNLDLPRRVEPVSSWFVRELDQVPRVGNMLRFHNAEFYVRKVRRGQVWEFNLKRINEEYEEDEKDQQ